MFGSHLSIAGGLTNALREARRLRMDCVQIFTRSQRQWKVKPISPEECDQWFAALQKMRWHPDTPDQPARIVSHNSYLINLASPDNELWRKSIDAHRAELERCEALRIPYCVSHPGAHLGQARSRRDTNNLHAQPSRDELAGLKRIVKALNAIHRSLPGCRALTCLETTVGSGTNLGYAFGHLAYIRAHVREPDRLGFCLDTCHITAAGYDMSADDKAAMTLELWDDICGLEHLKVVHVNDSQGAPGCRSDRHAHIGQGCCGAACFRAIVNHPALRSVPKILETPKGSDENGMNWDARNIRRLKRWIHKAHIQPSAAVA